MSEAQKMATEYWEGRAKKAEADLAAMKLQLILLAHDAVSDPDLWLAIKLKERKIWQASQ